MITKDNIESLIKFGGLLAYEVSWFNSVIWQTVIELRTFNEEFAKKKVKSMQDAGFTVKFISYSAANPNPPGAQAGQRKELT